MNTILLDNRRTLNPLFAALLSSSWNFSAPARCFYGPAPSALFHFSQFITPRGVCRSSRKQWHQIKLRSLYTTHSHRFGSVNSCSAVNKAALLHTIIADHQLLHSRLIGTWFQYDELPAITCDIAPDGFSIVHVDRKIVPGGRTCGGGAFVHRNMIKVRDIATWSKFETSGHPHSNFNYLKSLVHNQSSAHF